MRVLCSRGGLSPADKLTLLPCFDKQFTPLHFAVRENRTQSVWSLLQLQNTDVNVNQQDSEGDTPLMIAAAMNFSQIAALLLSFPHTDTSIRNKEGKNAETLYLESKFVFVPPSNTGMISGKAPRKQKVPRFNYQGMPPSGPAGLEDVPGWDPEATREQQWQIVLKKAQAMIQEGHFSL